MPTIFRIVPTLALAALAFAAVAQTEPVPEVVRQDGAEFEQFCTEEGAFTLVGSNNRITVSGPCSTVQVEGSDNVVHIARTDAIVVKGDRNRIDWRESSKDGIAPKQTVSGNGNTVITFDQALEGR